MGERSPHNDPDARRYIHRDENGQGDMTLAVFEGVTLALRDSLEVAKPRRPR